MKLTFLGKDSTPNDSPTLYATEWRDADELVKTGEDVRWLPRQRASALLLPGNDLWSFDGETVVFTYLSGEGTVQGYELTRDPALVAQCVTTFEAVWRAAIPHSEYTPS